MIIDIHMHIFPDQVAPGIIRQLSASSHLPPAGAGTALDAREQLAAAGCDWGVFQPIATSIHSRKGLAFAASCQGEGLLSFGSVHPDADPHQAVEDIIAAGFRGVKLHPYFQRRPIDHPGYVAIIRAAAAKGLPVLFHAGLDPSFRENLASAKQVAQVLDQVEDEPGLILIAAHLGGFDSFDQAEELIVGRNVYLDTALVGGRIDAEQYARIIDKHGWRRVLLGSDYPWQSPAAAIAHIRELGLGQEQEQGILGGNAERVLGAVKK